MPLSNWEQLTASSLDVASFEIAALVSAEGYRLCGLLGHGRPQALLKGMSEFSTPGGLLSG